MWNIKGAIANQDVSLLEFTSRARYKNISQGFKYAIKFLKLFDEITLFRNLFAGPRSNWISQRSSVPEVPARSFLWNQLGLMGVILQVLSSDASECPSCFLPDLVFLVCKWLMEQKRNLSDVFGWNKEIIAIGNWKGTERSREEHNTRL